jgi:hypothetical protein
MIVHYSFKHIWRYFTFQKYLFFDLKIHSFHTHLRTFKNLIKLYNIIYAYWKIAPRSSFIWQINYLGCLTLKNWCKVKLDTTNRFLRYEFLLMFYTLSMSLWKLKSYGHILKFYNGVCGPTLPSLSKGNYHRVPRWNQ